MEGSRAFAFPIAFVNGESLVFGAADLEEPDIPEVAAAIDVKSEGRSAVAKVTWQPEKGEPRV
jgi:hypothetical protein